MAPTEIACKEKIKCVSFVNTNNLHTLFYVLSKLRPSGTEFSFLICVLFLSTCDCNLEILGICKDLVLVRILLLLDCALDDYA